MSRLLLGCSDKTGHTLVHVVPKEFRVVLCALHKGCKQAALAMVHRCMDADNTVSSL